MAFDASALNRLLQATEGQVVVKANSKSRDNNFPIFGTPLDKAVLMYFPKTMLEANEAGEVFRPFTFSAHDYNLDSSQFGTHRCINGLSGEVFTELGLGYDGECPICNGQKTCFELANLQISAEAKRLSINIQTDSSETVKDLKAKFYKKMALSGSTEYIVVPVVIIPKAETGAAPATNALEEMKCHFLMWKKDRWDKSILKALEVMAQNPGHPCGLTLLGNYKYPTKPGKEPTAMEAAKNATYAVVDSSTYPDIIAKAEELAKEFTAIKAAEVIVACDYLTKDVLQAKVDGYLSKTRDLILMFEGSAETPATGLPVSTAEQALASFGAVQQVGVSEDVGMADTTTAKATTAPVGGTAFGGTPVQMG